MRPLNLKIAIIGLFIIGVNVQAQVESGSIGTETIDVVKLYSPTINDSDKLPITVQADSIAEEKKMNLDYEIFSYPVASTYSPTKAKANPLSQAEKEKMFKNYLVLGMGNYTTPLLDLYLTHDLDKERYVLGNIHHHSSQGGIKGVRLDNSFYNSGVSASYGVNKKKYGWKTGIGYSHKLYNWYGVPTDPNVFVFSNTALDQMSPSQIYQGFDITADTYFNEIEYFKKASLFYKRFWDDFGSAENHVFISPTVEVEVLKQKVRADVVIDYLGGNFNQEYMGTTPRPYGSFIFGVSPSFIYRDSSIDLNIGLGLYYYANLENKGYKGTNSRMLVYPEITGSYIIVDDVLTAYGGLEGGVQQNSYNQFASENPFISPTLEMRPTDKVYDLNIGLRGKLMKELSFNIKGFHKYEKSKYLYTANIFKNGPIALRKGYEFANSFDVVYDNVRSTGIYGALQYNYQKKLSLELNGSFTAYSTVLNVEAWNMPRLKVGMVVDYSFLKQWKAELDLNYIGGRWDQQIVSSGPTITYGKKAVKGFFDGNLKVTYQHNKKLSGFIRLNNFTNAEYQQWIQYPVQRFQVMAGATYKFDFK